MPLVSKGHFDTLLQKANAANIDKLVILSTATKPAQVENVNSYLASLVEETRISLWALAQFIGLC